MAKTEVHHDASRNDYMSCKLIYISHKDYIFFSVKHDSQVTLYRSDAAFASSVLLLSGQSSYSGQWRFVILGLRMPCLRLEKSLSGISCAKWAAVPIGMREKSRQGIAREKGEGTWK